MGYVFVKQLRVLRKLFFHLENSNINWVITGSLGFWLQGLEVEVNDIDLQTDKPGAYQVEEQFSEYVVQPVAFSSTEKIRSHFGVLSVDEVKVEIMGDIQKRNPDGSWDGPVDLRAHKRYVALEGLSIPVLSLAYEYEAYLKLGRVEKANVLKEWLENREAR